LSPVKYYRLTSSAEADLRDKWWTGSQCGWHARTYGRKPRAEHRIVTVCAFARRSPATASNLFTSNAGRSPLPAPSPEEIENGFLRREQSPKTVLDDRPFLSIHFLNTYLYKNIYPIYAFTKTARKISGLFLYVQFLNYYLFAHWEYLSVTTFPA
jgi:hypothetical protein